MQELVFGVTGTAIKIMKISTTQITQICPDFPKTSSFENFEKSKTVEPSCLILTRLGQLLDIIMEWNLKVIPRYELKRKSYP